MFPARRLAPLLCTVYLIACGVAGSGPRVSPVEGGIRKAALARLTVENQTDQPLKIGFRPAGASGGEVMLGTVAARNTEQVAPIVAGEPILLIARTRQGTEFWLPHRSFGIGAAWVWTIPADAEFVVPSGVGRR